MLSCLWDGDIKDLLMLTEKSNPFSGSSRFPLLLFFTICPMSYNCKYNALSVLLNK